MTVTTPTTHERLLDLLEDLPPESLATIEHFVKFLRAEAKQGRAVETVAAHQGYSPVPLPYGGCFGGHPGCLDESAS